MNQLTFRSLLLLMFSVVVLSCKGNSENKEEASEENAEPTTETEYTGNLPLDRLNLPEG